MPCWICFNEICVLHEKINFSIAHIEKLENDTEVLFVKYRHFNPCNLRAVKWECYGGVLMYARFWKRIIDFILSLLAIVILSPLLLVLIIAGTVGMGGNPFFTQERPGKDEKIFKLIKFRTMDNRRDEAGQLLPDEIRLNRYGRFLRSTSLDELPELINILRGDMAIVGPRPLLVRYLERYNDEQHHRHDVRPGLTGYAQAHGRNALSWEDKFAMDVWYTGHITFSGDMRILWDTVMTVLKREGVSSETSATMEEFYGSPEDYKVNWKPPY